ncbi:MAG: SURF1 family protein [Anaerolineales bacterium]|nr:SURF1 family protein [Anaerolineales bacterium]
MAKLITGPWLLKHASALVVLILLVNLGLWQLRRLEERRSLNENITAAMNQPALPLTGEPVDPAEFHFRRVEVTGVFDNATTIAIRNQLLGDQPGLHLVTPLRINGSETAVLVDRGWIPRGDSDPEPASLARYDLSGDVTIEGIAYQTQTRPSSLSPLDPQLREGQPRLVTWFRVDIDRIQAQVPYPLLPVFIRQLPPPNTAAEALPQPDSGIRLDEGPHLGYAIQWFSFAAILIVTYGLFLRQELRQGKGEGRSRVEDGR